MILSAPHRMLCALSAAVALCACGGSDHGPYTVSGSLSGLATGASVVLVNNGANSTTVSANGNFTFSATVPAGMSYSVTVATQPAGQACAVSQGSGSSTGAAISNVMVSCTALPYKVGVTVAGLTDVTGLVLQNNGGDNLTVDRSGTSSFSIPVGSKAGYAVSILSQPAGHTCSVLNGSGAVTNTSVNITVICPWHVAYLVFQHTAANPNTIAPYYIDQSTGTLTPGVAVMATGVDPAFVTVSPNHRFCYVANGDGTVSAYAIDPATGALTATAGSPIMMGSRPASITVSPNGKFAYVPNSGSNDISVYSIDTATGALAVVAGSPFASGAPLGWPRSVAIDPSGRFAYVANGQGFNSIDGFTIDAVTGALIPMTGSPFAAGAGPTWLAFLPNTNFLYEADFLLSGVTAYAFDPTTGALSAVAGNPYATQSYQILSLAIDPSGRFLYVPNTGLKDILGYAINTANGSLAPLSGSPAAANMNSEFMTIDPSGLYAYVTYYAGASNVAAFKIDQTSGALEAITDNALASTSGVPSMAIASLP